MKRDCRETEDRGASSFPGEREKREELEGASENWNEIEERSKLNI